MFDSAFQAKKHWTFKYFTSSPPTPSQRGQGTPQTLGTSSCQAKYHQAWDKKSNKIKSTKQGNEPIQSKPKPAGNSLRMQLTKFPKISISAHFRGLIMASFFSLSLFKDIETWARDCSGFLHSWHGSLLLQGHLYKPAQQNCELRYKTWNQIFLSLIDHFWSPGC